MNFREANTNDLELLRQLGLKSWTQFKKELTDENWKRLYKTLNSLETYANLLTNSDGVVCENDRQEIIGMAFLVPRGNPTEVYDKDWCHLRFVSVDPNYRGKGVGKSLTEHCIKMALNNKEQTMALHTSEIMSSARHIYKKIGFSIVKELEPRLGVRYWLYTLTLDEVNEKFISNRLNPLTLTSSSNDLFEFSLF